MADGLYIGIMSGTSLDAIDITLVSFKNDQFQIIKTHSHSWPEQLKERLKQLIEKEDSLDEMLQLDQLCAEQYAQASLNCLELAGVSAGDIAAIGCHGQTIRHAPNQKPAYTLQIGNPATIAEITGITTISDFRSRDIAAGGQGAPLAPAFHKAIFSHPHKKRIILNIGGIANITVLDGDRLIGLDTGPGNRLLDDWINHSLQKSHDHNGEFAASGEVIEPLLKQLREDPYFNLPFPKSTGSDYFNLEWVLARITDYKNETAANIQATLTALTAETVKNEINKNLPGADDILICGGGAQNHHLVSIIEKHFQDKNVSSTDNFGCPPDWVEAVAFAWLANRTLSGQPGNLPDVTGAKGERICGGVYFA